MCCFSTPTHVFGTKIFARLLRPGVQGLAYQMEYKAEQPTAMILPLPVALPAREDSVRFKNLKEYSRLFSDLEKGFPQLPTNSLSRSKSATASAAPEAQLAVHDVGDFVATFVPSQADFGRLDPRFVLSKEVWAKLPQYQSYGFAVFQLKELRGSPHPIALEFDTRMADTVFFPTVHIHDGTVHDKDDFDHVLYTQDAVFDQRAGSYEGPDNVDSHTGFVRSKDQAQSFVMPTQSQGLLAPDLLVHKSTMRGTFANRDLTFDLKAIAAQPRGCGRCDAGPGASIQGSLPVGAALAGLAWIIRRRDARRSNS